MGKQHLSLMTSSRCGRCWIKSIKRHRQFEQMFLQKSSSLINKAQQSTPKRDWSGLPWYGDQHSGIWFYRLFFWIFMEWHTHDLDGNVMVEASLCSALNVCCCLLSKAHSWDSLCPVLPNRLLGAGFFITEVTLQQKQYWYHISCSYPLPHLLPGSQKSKLSRSSESYKRPPLCYIDWDSSF